MIWALLGVVAASLLWLVGCTVWSILVPEVVGPGISFGLVALSVLGWNSFVFDSWLRFVAGGLPFALGAYLSLGGYLRLGVHRSQGYEGDLVVTGPYRLSRNPQYVGAMCGFVGLATMCNSAPGLVAALLACAWFVLLPFAEEPWLVEKLGPPYQEYALHVPRYISVQALLRRPGE